MIELECSNCLNLWNEEEREKGARKRKSFKSSHELLKETDDGWKKYKCLECGQVRFRKTITNEHDSHGVLE